MQVCTARWFLETHINSLPRPRDLQDQNLYGEDLGQESKIVNKDLGIFPMLKDVSEFLAR